MHRKNTALHSISQTSKTSASKKEYFQRLAQEIWKYRGVYIILLPPILWYILFQYVPMAGLQLAFKDYKVNQGIWGSPWVGFKHFDRLFSNPRFINSVILTLRINIGRLFVTFPFPIILALLLNELRMNRYKRALQTIFTFPNFLSWVVITGITINVLSFDGLINSLIRLFGGQPISFIGNESLFIPLVYATEVWKSAGWGSIIYLAAMAGIDPGLYEASEIDGATRIQKIMYITLPSILPTVTVMFVLATGNIMRKGFEQVFNLSNPAVKNVSEILDVYIYNITFRAVPNFGYSTALSLFRSIVNLFFLVVANAGAKWITGSGLFGGEENINE